MGLKEGTIGAEVYQFRRPESLSYSDWQYSLSLFGNGDGKKDSLVKGKIMRTETVYRALSPGAYVADLDMYSKYFEVDCENALGVRSHIIGRDAERAGYTNEDLWKILLESLVIGHSLDKDELKLMEVHNNFLPEEIVRAPYNMESGDRRLLISIAPEQVEKYKLLTKFNKFSVPLIRMLSSF